MTTHPRCMNISRLLRIVLLSALTAAPALLFAQDDDLASLRSKAEKGNAIAQYNLGLAYAEGRGIAADPVEAYVWLSLAMENGARGLALNNLAATLDATTLDTAKQRLASRRPGPAPAATDAPAPTVEQQLTADKKQLSAELAQAWKEVDTLKTDLAQAKEAAPAADQFRQQRDSLATKLGEVVAELAATRAERERLQELAAQNEKAGQSAAELTRAAQEKARLAEMRASELSRDLEGAKTELERATISLAAAQQSSKPVADTSAVDQKARELQSAVADLDAARAAIQQLSASRTQLEAEKANLEHMLNTAQSAALEAGKQADELKTQLAALTEKSQAPAPAAPAYPDLSARVKELEALAAAAPTAVPAPPTYPDLSAKVAELEAALATAQKPVAPAYPDLSARVAELETALAAAQKPSAPSYPDLSGRVAELEAALATERTRVASVAAAPTPVVAADGDLAKELADTQLKLDSALRTFTLLEKERDELLARANRSSETLTTDRDSLASRLSAAEAKAESAQGEVARLEAALTALQRSTSQSARDYAANQILLSQLRGANAVLAQENYQLKTALARDPNAARNGTVTPVTVPTTAAAAGKTYVVVAGDSLSKISQRVYGNPQRWREIYQANLDRLRGENSLKVGLELRIP